MKRLTSEGWPWYKDRFIYKSPQEWPQDLSISMNFDSEGQWWARWAGIETSEDMNRGRYRYDPDRRIYGNPLQYPNIRYWNIDDGDKDILTLVWGSEGSEGSEG